MQSVVHVGGITLGLVSDIVTCRLHTQPHTVDAASGAHHKQQPPLLYDGNHVAISIHRVGATTDSHVLCPLQGHHGRSVNDAQHLNHHILWVNAVNALVILRTVLAFLLTNSVVGTRRKELGDRLGVQISQYSFKY